MRLLSVVAVLTATAGLAADPESQPPHGPWRFEVSITPVVGQLNDLVTMQLGVGGQLAVALSPHMRLVVGGLWNYRAVESSFERQLQLDLNRRVTGDERRLTLFIPAAAYAGTEFGLLHGQVAAFRFPHRLEFTMAGLAGAVSTRVRLKPPTPTADGSISPPTSGDAGLRPTLGVGLGLHFEFLERFSARLEMRHFAIPGRTTSVNGCGANDLQWLDSPLRVPRGPPSPGCRAESFEGVDPETGLNRANDLPYAVGIVRDPSSLFQSYLVAQVSVGVTF